MVSDRVNVPVCLIPLQIAYAGREVLGGRTTRIPLSFVYDRGSCLVKPDCNEVGWCREVFVVLACLDQRQVISDASAGAHTAILAKCCDTDSDKNTDI